MENKNVEHLKNKISELELHILKYKQVLISIRDYEAYNWNNDRQFINSRIYDVLK